MTLARCAGDAAEAEPHALSAEADGFAEFKRRGTLRITKVIMDGFRRAAAPYLQKGSLQAFAAPSSPSFRWVWRPQHCREIKCAGSKTLTHGVGRGRGDLLTSHAVDVSGMPSAGRIQSNQYSTICDITSTFHATCMCRVKCDAWHESVPSETRHLPLLRVKVHG